MHRNVFLTNYYHFFQFGIIEIRKKGTMGHRNILTAKTEFSIAGLRTGARFW